MAGAVNVQVGFGVETFVFCVREDGMSDSAEKQLLDEWEGCSLHIPDRPERCLLQAHSASDEAQDSRR